ncbi:MAG: twin-arginine translocation signal domain-containing protein, partial [Actinobacteria bacterium]
MATRDTGMPAITGISRRDFVKVTAAATAVAGCGLDFAYDAEKAAAYEGNTAYQITATTCPYCSASCGQRVVVEKATNKVVDIYGDFESPMNSGGLCAKGAGTLQLVNNARRVGVGTGHAALGMDADFD